ncbi:MAG: hypothetical protein ACXWJR_13370, partial [Xanthobacteraceae bacterium]
MSASLKQSGWAASKSHVTTHRNGLACFATASAYVGPAFSGARIFLPSAFQAWPKSKATQQNAATGLDLAQGAARGRSYMTICRRI